MNFHPENITLIVIDCFCGAGGVTQGFHTAEIDGQKCAVVVIGINHDAKAIASHAKNHPETKHFVEDFCELDPNRLVSIVNWNKKLYPNAKVLFWMSAECTHHSIAKGGMSRDEDSRSLAVYAYKYIEILQPDIIGVENVKEFLTWGPVKMNVVTDKSGNELYCPLDKKKRDETSSELKIRKEKKVRKFQRYNYLPVYVPVKERKTEYYNAWVNTIKSYGYHYDYKLLNAADYGAYTSRLRYFGIFAKDKENICFPQATHSKDGKMGLKKWLPVKNVLELDEVGESIFDRKIPLSEKTLERIHAGLIKFVAGGKDQFMVKYNSMQQNGKYNAPGVDEPCPAVTTQNRLGVCFISKCFSGHPDSKNITVEAPAHTITNIDHHSLIHTQFLSAYYGTGHNCHSLLSPSPVIGTKDTCALINPQFMCSYNYKDHPKDLQLPSPTLLTKDRLSLVSPQFMDQQFGKSKPASIENVLGALTTNPKYNLVSCNWILNPNFNNIGSSVEDPAPTILSCRKHHYLVNPQYQSKGGGIDQPCFTLIARMDKMPPSLVKTSCETDNLPSFIKVVDNILLYEIYESDTPMIQQIKEFMALYGITDVFRRMLFIIELKRIMGFPDDYELIGTSADQKKFIGNAVECKQSRANSEAIALSVRKQQNKIAI